MKNSELIHFLKLKMFFSDGLLCSKVLSIGKTPENLTALFYFLFCNSKPDFLASFQNRPQSIKLVLCFFLFLLGG